MLSRPGFHTSEFLVTLATVIGSAATAMQGSLSPHWAGIFSTAAVIAYAISRGLAKVEPRGTTPPAA